MHLAFAQEGKLYPPKLPGKSRATTVTIVEIVTVYNCMQTHFEKGAARLNVENSLRGEVKCALGSHYCGIRNIGYDY